MGHLYAELAGAYGNRGEYVTKAIEHYRTALKLDPAAGFLVEELTDLYIQAGRLRDAILEAEEMLKQNPDNLDARRILGRIYTRMIGDTQQGKIDEKMLRKRHRAVPEDRRRRTPKDMDSWLTLGRLYKAANNSVEAEKAYNQALALDPNSEDALTGLAIVYSDLGDTAKAIEKLKQLYRAQPQSAHADGAGATPTSRLRDYKSAAAGAAAGAGTCSRTTRGVKRALAQDLLFSENYDESLKLFQEVAAEEPARRAGCSCASPRSTGRSAISRKARAALEQGQATGPRQPGSALRRSEPAGRRRQDATEAIALLKSILDGHRAARPTRRPRRPTAPCCWSGWACCTAPPTSTQQAVDDVPPDRGARPGQSAARIGADDRHLPRRRATTRRRRQEADAAVAKFPNDRMVKMVHASLLADTGQGGRGRRRRCAR